MAWQLARRAWALEPALTGCLKLLHRCERVLRDLYFALWLYWSCKGVGIGISCSLAASYQGQQHQCLTNQPPAGRQEPKAVHGALLVLRDHAQHCDAHRCITVSLGVTPPPHCGRKLSLDKGVAEGEAELLSGTLQRNLKRQESEKEQSWATSVLCFSS